MSVIEYYLSNGDTQLSPHFMLHEFKSGDGEDRVLVSEELIDILEQMYQKLNCTSIVVTSGYRTPSHSVSVGGYENDSHTKGLAADIICYDMNGNISGKLVCCAAQDIGLNGIGYMGNAVHVDIYNRHWWGDETNGNNVADFYSYFGVDNKNEDETNDLDFNEGEVVDMNRERLRYEINKAYLTLVGRNADSEGLENWLNNLECGVVSWKTFYDQLSESDEAIKKYLINVCFLGELGRRPSERELQDRIDQYHADNATKESWLDEFHNSEEAYDYRSNY